MGVKRRVLCRWLGMHAGDIRTTRVRAEEANYALTYIRCSRCGNVSPLDLRPYHEIEQAHLPGFERA